MKIVNVRSVYEYIRQSRKVLDSVLKQYKQGDITGFTPPSTLVGDFGYPKVSVGMLFTTDYNAYMYDSPRYWANTGYDVPKIFQMRSMLVNAKTKVNIHDINSSFVQKITLSTLSVDEIAVDLKLDKIRLTPYSSEFNMPHNISADVNKMNLTDNVRIEKNLEKTYYDKDLKANAAVSYLYKEGIDENKISKALSLGAMGVKRKIVPTRWSITAVDDMLGKEMIEEVKDYPADEVYGVITGGILGNVFTFVFIKGKWSFELIEAWNRGGELMVGESDYETYSGRKEYVKNTAGAYYAVRMAVLEYLKKIKKQFSVIALREITPEYFVPLGVWVVRESARKALANNMTLANDAKSVMELADKAAMYVHDIEKRSALISRINARTLITFI